MNVKIIVSSILISLFLIACGGGNGNRRAGLIDTSGVRQFGVGQDHACAVLKTGKVSCWGWNLYGQLGNNSTSNENEPIEVTLAEGKTALAVSAGFFHTCAILSDHSVVCWGYNENGELGVGTSSNEVCTINGSDYDCIKTPAQVNLGAGRTAKGIYTGNYHTCALLDNDSVVCWGWNVRGQFGGGAPHPSKYSRSCEAAGRKCCPRNSCRT